MSDELAGLTTQDIAAQIGANHATVRKYIQLEGIEPVRVHGRTNGAIKYYDLETVRAAVEPHIQKHMSHDTTPNIDPETGLTWAQKERRERARALQAENDKAEAIESHEMLYTAQHFDTIRAIVESLERIPAKLQGKLGLTPEQAAVVREMLDTARTEAAAKIEEMV
jgi:hypothetical protein